MPLGARDDLGDARFVGCELDADARERASPRDVLERATRGGFDFIIHPAAVVDDVDDDSTTPWAHSDEELTSTEWSTRVVLRTSRGVERGQHKVGDPSVVHHPLRHSVVVDVALETGIPPLLI